MKKFIAILVFAFILLTKSVSAYYDFGPTTIKVGSVGQYVKYIQMVVGVGVDGVFGQMTKAAVMAWQASHGLFADGLVGNQTKVAMNQKSIVSTSATNYKYAKTDTEFIKILGEDVRYYGRTSNFSVAPTMMEDSAKTSSGSIARVSETNVQVKGIDEPDIVKTDGKNLFTSKPQYWHREMVEVDSLSKEYNKPKTKIIGITPISDMGIKSDLIEEAGEMLLDKESNTLIIFSGEKIIGYNVLNPNKPTKSWTIGLEKNTSVTTSRLKNGIIYLVTNTNIHRNTICPIVPLLQANGVKMNIPCTQIWIPEKRSSLSELYTIVKLNSKTGSILNKTSIAGSWDETISVFDNNLYFATEFEDYQPIFNIMISAISPYVSSGALAKLNQIINYDISDENKLEEIGNLLEEELAKLGDDERLKIETELQNTFKQKMEAQLSNLTKTRITRIPLTTMEIASVGTVPGVLVNQFAMDEYAGYLRVATTTGNSWGSSERSNNVFVLDTNLKIVGNIKNLGLTEKIYSVRFTGDTGYLVTFRQIDPFYVLDLRNPFYPKVSGELKIPGYSSYLEDLGNGLVLGLGRENGKMKLSIFDVTNPNLPQEVSKYSIDGYSEAEYNHHAFLKDGLHKIFFVPSNAGGYVFSYSGRILTLKKAVSGDNIKRAIYVNDYLYMISNDKISVLDENTWEKIKEFSF